MTSPPKKKKGRLGRSNSQDDEEGQRPQKRSAGLGGGAFGAPAERESDDEFVNPMSIDASDLPASGFGGHQVTPEGNVNFADAIKRLNRDASDDEEEMFN